MFRSRRRRVVAFGLTSSTADQTRSPSTANTTGTRCGRPSAPPWRGGDAGGGEPAAGLGGSIARTVRAAARAASGPSPRAARPPARRTDAPRCLLRRAARAHRSSRTGPPPATRPLTRPPPSATHRSSRTGRPRASARPTRHAAIRDAPASPDGSPPATRRPTRHAAIRGTPALPDGSPPSDPPVPTRHAAIRDAPALPCASPPTTRHSDGPGRRVRPQRRAGPGPSAHRPQRTRLPTPRRRPPTTRHRLPARRLPGRRAVAGFSGASPPSGRAGRFSGRSASPSARSIAGCRPPPGARGGSGPRERAPATRVRRT